MESTKPWKDEYDATDDGSICPQFDISTGNPVGDEDCLHLNVYTPKLDSKYGGLKCRLYKLKWFFLRFRLSKKHKFPIRHSRFLYLKVFFEH